MTVNGSDLQFTIERANLLANLLIEKGIMDEDGAGGIVYFLHILEERMARLMDRVVPRLEIELTKDPFNEPQAKSLLHELQSEIEEIYSHIGDLSALP